MKYSVIFWILCILWCCVLVTVWPCHNGYERFLRGIVWFLGSRVMKYFLFRRIPIDLRFENKETVIVTGSSCGIGADIASKLSERSGKVIWTARDVDKAQKVLNDIRWTYYHGERGYVLYLDLASKESIRKFVDEFKRREKKLNCIVLNAAYHGNRRLTADGFEQNLGVNHLGHMYLVYLLIDLLKASAPSRIVVVTSDLHKFIQGVKFDDLQYEHGYLGLAAYSHSKLLNILFVRELARRLEGTNVTVYAAHPGTPIKSELMRDTWLGSLLFDQLLRAICFFFCRSAMDGAQTPVYCALSKELAKESGKYYENLRLDTASAAATDDKAAARLWDMSCDMLGISKNWV